MAELPLTVDDLDELGKELFERTMKAKKDIGNLPDQIIENVIKSFETNIRSTMLGMMGFRKDTYGRDIGWEIDHCNGRSGNSIGGRSVNDLMDEKFTEWFHRPEVQKKMNEVLDFNMDPLIKSMKMLASSKLESMVRKKVNELLTRKADAIAEELVKESTKTFRVVAELVKASG